MAEPQGPEVEVEEEPGQAANVGKEDEMETSIPEPAPEATNGASGSGDDADIQLSGEDEVDFPWSRTTSDVTLLERVKDSYFSPQELEYRITKLGENVNVVEETGEGKGPIHYFAEGRHKFTTGLLVVLTIHGNAELNLTTTKGGKTALHIAAKRNDLGCIKTLVSLGADVNVEDHYGKTPYDVAKLERVTKLRAHSSESEVQMLQFDRSRTVLLQGRDARKRGFEETLDVSRSFMADEISSLTQEDSPILKALEAVGGRVGRLKTPVEQKIPRKRRGYLQFHRSEGEFSILGSTLPSPPIGFEPRPLGMNRINCSYYKELEESISEKLSDESYDPTPQQALKLVRLLQQQTGYRTMYGSRILCLDGGGIRGLVQMTILQEIERRMGKRITDLFDWIVGTSTGGIIALAICYGPSSTGRKTVRQLRDIYWVAKDEAFQENSGDGLFTFLSKGNSKNLEEILQGWLGEDVRMDRRQSTSYRLPKVLIPAVHKKDKVQLHFFNNCFNNEHSNELVWKVARYTSAAPFYFTELDHYIDGGVLANNPAEEGLTVIQDFYRERGEKLPISMLVSIGSGINPSKPIGKIDVQSNALNIKAWMNFFGVVEQAILNKTAHTNCQSRCREQGINYFRFNPVLNETVDSGQKDTRKLLDMLWKTRAYLNEPQAREDLDKLEQLLRDSEMATTPDL